MTGQPRVADRRYLDPGAAMARILELANGAEADNGRISIGPINRILLDEGASVDEYRAGFQRAIDEGLLEREGRLWFEAKQLGESSAELQQSLLRMSAIVTRYPQITIVPSHDPRGCASIPEWSPTTLR